MKQDQPHMGTLVVDPIDSWAVHLPLRVKLSKKRDFLLNMNVYRNANFRTLSAAKIIFTELVLPLVQNLPKFSCVSISYRLFPASNRLVDIANVCSIVDKFFSDTLVSAGRIEDDNYNVVQSVDFQMGCVDTSNPRVEATIMLVKPVRKSSTKGKVMRIILNQVEIELALTNYIGSLLNVQQGISFDIDIKATRGEGGMTAEIELIEPKDGSAVLPVVAPTLPKPVTPAPVKPTEPAPVVTPPVVETPAVEPVAEPVPTPEPVVQPDPVPFQEPVLAPAEVVEEPAPVQEQMAAVEDKAEAEVEVPAAVVEPEVRKPVVGLFANLKRPVNTPS